MSLQDLSMKPADGNWKGISTWAFRQWYWVWNERVLQLLTLFYFVLLLIDWRAFLSLPAHLWNSWPPSQWWHSRCWMMLRERLMNIPLGIRRTSPKLCHCCCDCQGTWWKSFLLWEDKMKPVFAEGLEDFAHGVSVLGLLYQVGQTRWLKTTEICLGSRG